MLTNIDTNMNLLLSPKRTHLGAKLTKYKHEKRKSISEFYPLIRHWARIENLDSVS